MVLLPCWSVVMPVQIAVPYDWRLPIPVMEKRDGFFTRVKHEVRACCVRPPLRVPLCVPLHGSSLGVSADTQRLQEWGMMVPSCAHCEPQCGLIGSVKATSEALCDVCPTG